MRRSKRAVVREIALELGISETSVYRALSGSTDVSANTREKVLKLFSEKTDEPINSLDGEIVFLTELYERFLESPYFSMLLSGLIEESASRKLYLKIMPTETFSGNMYLLKSRALKTLERALGIIIPTKAPESLVSFLSKEHIRKKVVICHTSQTYLFSTINIDNFNGIKRLTKLLIDNGYRKIVFMGVEGMDNPEMKERIRGYTRAMQENSLEPHIFMAVRKSKYQSLGDIGRENVKSLLTESRNTEAIMAFNDELAIGIIKGLHEMGLKVPEDVGVTGFDNLPQFRFFEPKLTTVHNPVYETGRKAVELALSGENRSVKMPTKIIPGESTKFSK